MLYVLFPKLMYSNFTRTHFVLTMMNWPCVGLSLVLFNKSVIAFALHPILCCNKLFLNSCVYLVNWSLDLMVVTECDCECLVRGELHLQTNLT